MTYAKYASSRAPNLLSTRKPILVHLDMELTERCNNACIHCYINQPENDPILKSREMDTTCIKAILVRIQPDESVL